MMGFFKFKKDLGYWVMVRWKHEAIEHGIGYDFMKEIIHFNNDKAFNIETYSDVRIKFLKKDGIIIHDSTKGQWIPKESQFVPASREILGVLQFSKRL